MAQDLARLIPALAPARRLSKSLIVQESAHYLQGQREMCLAAAAEIQGLLQENLEVITEVNTWREQYGMPPRQPQVPGEAVQRLLKVDQDVLGTFPGGFGDNAAGDEHAPENGRDAQRDAAPSGLTAEDLNHAGVISSQRDHFLPTQEAALQETTDQQLKPSVESWEAPPYSENQIPPDMFNLVPDSLSMDPNLNSLIPLSPYTPFDMHPGLYPGLNVASPDLNLYQTNEQTDFGFLPRTQYTQNS